MNKFLLLQVVGYCLQKLKFDYFELTLNNLNEIFYRRPEIRVVFSSKLAFIFLEKKKTFGRLN